MLSKSAWYLYPYEIPPTKAAQFIILLMSFSSKYLENHLDFESEFVEFLNKNTLKIYNSNFVEQNLTDLILDLNNLKKDHDVLDNFILQKKDN